MLHLVNSVGNKEIDLSFKEPSLIDRIMYTVKNLFVHLISGDCTHIVYYKNLKSLLCICSGYWNSEITFFKTQYSKKSHGIHNPSQTSHIWQKVPVRIQ